MDPRDKVPEVPAARRGRGPGRSSLSSCGGAEHIRRRHLIIVALILLRLGEMGGCAAQSQPVGWGKHLAPREQHLPRQHRDNVKEPPPPNCKDNGYVNSNMEQTNAFVITGAPRGRRATSTLDFICPRSRCQETDCVVARREVRNGRWEWVTENTGNVHVKSSERSPEVTLVRYVPATIDVAGLELWCFTKEQLQAQPVCSEWEISYPPGKQKLTTCTHTDHANPPSQSTHPNLAISLVVDYAKERNLSNCWLCQQMPKSASSSILSPIPFNKVDYLDYNWNNIGDRLQEHPDECYTPTFPTADYRGEKYEGLAKLVVDEVNAKHRPHGINMTTLLKITYVQLYTKLGFEYRMQLALTQTNCSSPAQKQICLPQPYTPAVLVEALVSVLPWIGSRSIDEVKVNVLDCAKPLQPKVSKLRDCSQYFPPVLVNELINVSICFQGAGTGDARDVGHSQCARTVRVAIRQVPLPERVYMVCGGKAYGCVPHHNIRGTCYLAYLIPMIRKVEKSEMAALYPPLHRHKRTLTTTDMVFGALLPSYGVYVTQQEVSSLSKVLETHLNASAKAIVAEHKEMTEVKRLAIENRMTLDVVLASKGGSCKLIGVECCTYISDATQEVMDMVHSNELGVQELHQLHGFNLGDISETFGTWGAGLFKFLLGIAVLVMIVCFLGSCVVVIIKTILKKAAAAAIDGPRVIASSSGPSEMTCTIADTQWRPPVPK